MCCISYDTLTWVHILSPTVEHDARGTRGKHGGGGGEGKEGDGRRGGVGNVTVG